VADELTAEKLAEAIRPQRGEVWLIRTPLYGLEVGRVLSADDPGWFDVIGTDVGADATPVRRLLAAGWDKEPTDD
jgi:hypothetical protein